MFFSKVQSIKTVYFKHFTSYRNLCSVVEERFAVPWGEIGGKRWGNQSGQPILALHGYFDNSASFDKLLPLLNINRPVLAIDIPGHGKSCFSKGITPNFIQLLVWLRYLIKYVFKWEKVTLLGHSFGSNLSFNYAGIFPDEVDTYISLDCARINMVPKLPYLIEGMRKLYNGNFEYLGAPQEGTYESYLNYMFETRQSKGMPLSKGACEILLSRELEKVGENTYKSNIDRRLYLKYGDRPTLSFLQGISKNIKCNVLSIRATNGVLVKERLKPYEQHITNMKKGCRKLVYVTVEGGHHVHLETPEEVSTHINTFLN